MAVAPPIGTLSAEEAEDIARQAEDNTRQARRAVAQGALCHDGVHHFLVPAFFETLSVPRPRKPPCSPARFLAWRRASLRMSNRPCRRTSGRKQLCANREAQPFRVVIRTFGSDGPNVVKVRPPPQPLPRFRVWR